MALAWAFRQGEVLRYRIRHKVELKVVDDAEGRERSEPFPALDVILAWRVTKVAADGTAEIEQRIEHVCEQVNARIPDDLVVVYDSADPTTINNAWSDLRSRLYRPILGATYFLKIDKRGDLIDARLPREALSGWDEFKLQPRADQDYLFTPEGLRALFAVIPELPGEPIAQGATWHSRRTTPGTLGTTLDEAYSVAGQDGKVISFKGKPHLAVHIAQAPPPKEEKGAPKQRVIPLTDARLEKQSGESQLTFDLVTGRPKSFSRRHEYELKLTFTSSALFQSEPPHVSTYIEKRVIQTNIELLPSQAGR